MGQRAVLLLALVLALAVSAGEAAPQSVPAAALPAAAVVTGFAPAERVGNAFRNLDPAYRRGSLWTRLRPLFLGGTSPLGEHPVPPLHPAPVDPAAVRTDSPRSPVTWD